MIITKEFFEGLHMAICKGSFYDLGPQMPVSKRGIIHIHPGGLYQLDGEVMFGPTDIDRLKVSLVGFTGGKPSPGASNKTLNPEELNKMRRLETSYDVTLIRLRLKVIQMFVTPDVDVVASKNRILELNFADIGKRLSLTPSRAPR